MQRSQQHALMFLLGALLTGGALGFTADRVMLRDRLGSRQGSAHMRQRLADELDLSAAQRAQLDTILDARHRQMRAILTPVRPQMDSASETARLQIRRMLTESQRASFDEMHREMAAASKENDKR